MVACPQMPTVSNDQVQGRRISLRVQPHPGSRFIVIHAEVPTTSPDTKPRNGISKDYSWWLLPWPCVCGAERDCGTTRTADTFTDGAAGWHRRNARPHYRTMDTIPPTARPPPSRTTPRTGTPIPRTSRARACAASIRSGLHECVFIMTVTPICSGPDAFVLGRHDPCDTVRPAAAAPLSATSARTAVDGAIPF